MIEASVVISTFNRAESLRRCLDALALQTQPAGDFEVLVVVDGSTDRTREILDSYSPPFRIRVLWQTNQGQSVAFNQATKIAEGRVLIFLDDDITPVPGFVTEHLHLHQTRQRVVGIGQITNTLPPGSDWFAHHFADDWQNHYSQLNQGFRQPGWQDCYAGNISIPKDAFQETGGFAKFPRGNDIEIAYRLSQHGYSFVYLPGALGDQDEQKGFSALIEDSERAGSGCVQIYHDHPSTLHDLLGLFSEQNPRIALVLRLLLFINFPPGRLGWPGWLLNKLTGTDLAYRLLHRYAYWRGVRHSLCDQESWQNIIGGIPILMFHAFGAAEEHASRYILPIKRFSQQMAWLKRRGYKVLSLNEYVRCIREFHIPPSRSVVITMDDGYADNRTLANPILKKYGFPATVFLVTDHVGGKNVWDDQSGLSGRTMLSWNDIHEMQLEGIEFGSHSCTHPNLLSIPPESAWKEIVDSRDAIQNNLGVTTSLFAYPFGKFNLTLATIVEQSGFEGSCTIMNGLNTLSTPVHLLRRVEIYGTDSLLQFSLAVHFGARGNRLKERFLQVIAPRKNGHEPGEKKSLV